MRIGAIVSSIATTLPTFTAPVMRMLGTHGHCAPPPTGLDPLRFAPSHGLWSPEPSAGIPDGLPRGRGGSGCGGAGGSNGDNPDPHKRAGKDKGRNVGVGEAIAALLLCGLACFGCDAGSQTLPAENPEEDLIGGGDTHVPTDAVSDTTTDVVPDIVADGKDGADIADVLLDTGDATPNDIPDSEDAGDTIDTPDAPDASDASDVPDVSTAVTWCTNVQGNDCLNAAVVTPAVIGKVMLSIETGAQMIIRSGTPVAQPVAFAEALFEDPSKGPITLSITKTPGDYPSVIAESFGVGLQFAPPVVITDVTDPNYYADNNIAYWGVAIWDGGEVTITANSVTDPSNPADTTTVLWLKASQAFTNASNETSQCTMIYFTPCLPQLEPITF